MPIGTNIYTIITACFLMAACATSEGWTVERDYTGTRSSIAACQPGIACAYSGNFAVAPLPEETDTKGLYLRDEETDECILIVLTTSQHTEFETLRAELLVEGDFPNVKGMGVSGQALTGWNKTPLCDGVDIADHILKYQSAGEIVFMTQIQAP